MASDIVAVPADGYAGVAPAWGHSAVSSAVVMAGGMDYIGEPEVVDARKCTARTKADTACAAFAGDDGLCVGHRKAVQAAR